MADKKIIIVALVLAVLLVVGAWYYSRGPADGVPSPSPGAETISEQGILIGNPDATVAIEEYTSFLCPACARFASVTLDQIKQDYIKTGKVKIMIYVFPPYELGWAALCAQEQNKFIEFHDYTFAHQNQITEEKSIKDMASNAGLNSQVFDACYASGKYNDKVAKWFEEGERRGVDSTPTFFINGQKLIGAQPYGDFKKIIDEKLNQAQ